MKLPPFQALLDAHGRDVHRFLVATVGVDQADDCYQETWIAALRAYPELRRTDNLQGWVLTIARNKALDHFRRVKRQPLAVGADARFETLGASAVAAPHLADREIWGYVASLPDKQRLAVGLRYALDAEYRLIAEVMEISEDAARKNVEAGLRNLRVEYER